MANSPVDKVRGTLDLLPDELHERGQVSASLERQIASFGYRPIELPILEQTELFLRKSGQEMASKLYAFRHHNRDLCLRPEVTASVMRTYIAHLQNAGLPQRLAYTGPVFRYEAPQRGRYRQFTEIGVELIGAAAPAADAEVIGLAAGGLEGVGLRDYQIVIGHIGIVQTYLAGLRLDERVRDWLTWSIERLRQQGDDGLHHALDGLLPTSSGGQPIEAALTASLRASADGEGWATLPADETERIVLRVLSNAGFDLTGSSRSPAEIARRLVTKLTRPADNSDLTAAVAFLRRLAELRGAPATVLPALRALLAEEHLSEQPLQQVEELLALLAAYGLPAERLTLDAGLGRGLHYYTGILFEIYAGAGGSEHQLAGGGRYDDLAAVLGARERIPACGFAYGLERITEELQARRVAPLPAPDRPDCLVCAVSPLQAAYAARVAQHLRSGGLCVELDVRQRGVRANLELANRRGLVAVAIVGEAEAASGTYQWRDMGTTRQEARLLGADRHD
jgi:histidyl-tRNA synthetase